jgi:hypothetical protein
MKDGPLFLSPPRWRRYKRGILNGARKEKLWNL